MKRRVLFGALAAGAALLLTTLPVAANNCSAGDDVCVDTNNDTNSTVPIAEAGSSLPVHGTVAAGQGSDPATQGYVFADGDAGNGDPLWGYAGIHMGNNNGGDFGPLMGTSDNKDFNRNGGNEGATAAGLLELIGVPAP